MPLKGWSNKGVTPKKARWADASAHRAFFGVTPLFDQPFNGMVCRLADLQLLRECGQAQGSGVARFARSHLEQALRSRGEGMQAACRELIIALLPGGRCTAQQLSLIHI